MDSFEYPYNVFLSHLEKFPGNEDLRGKTFVEIGPGDSIATSILSSCYGSKSILIDKSSYVNKNIEFYKEFSCFLKQKNLISADNLFISIKLYL